MEHLSAYFHALVVHFGYAGLFVVMFLGNMGMPTGTEVVMPTAGALAATGHFPTIEPIPGWVIVGAVGTLAEVCGVLGVLLWPVIPGVAEKLQHQLGFKEVTTSLTEKTAPIAEGHELGEIFGLFPRKDP